MVIKIGDKVRCVEPISDLQYFEIYTVAEIDEEFLSVKEIENGHNSFFIDRFEKLQLELNSNIKTL